MPASARLTRSASPPIIVSLALSTFAVGTSLPITTLLATDLAPSTFLAGLVVASRWVTRLVVNLPAGGAAERYGPWPVFVSGIVIIVLAMALGATSPSWPVLLASRVLEGGGAAMSLTAGMSYVAGLGEPRHRGRLFGQYQLGQRSGYWFGPLAGGLVAGAAGLRAALWLGTGVALLALIPLVFASRPSVGRAELAQRTFLDDVRGLLRNREFVLVGLAALVAFVGMTGAQYTALPVLINRDLGFGPEVVGIAIFAANAVGFVLVYPAGTVSDRYGRRPTVAALLAVSAVGFVGVATLSGVAVVGAAAAVLGFGQVLRGPATQAYAIDAAGASGGEAASALYRTLSDVGSAAGPLCAGWLLGGGSGGFFLFNGLLAAAVLVAFLAGTNPPAPIGGR